MKKDNELKITWDFIAAELFLKSLPAFKAQPKLSVGQYWEQMIREPVIPFNSTERRTKLKHAYDALREYLADFCDSPGDRR